MQTPAFLFLSMALCMGCASEYNTVRLKQTAEQDILTLRTQHYLQTDHDHVQELERGERRAEISATRLRDKDGSSRLTVKLALRLYQDDSPPAQSGQLEAATAHLALQVSAWTSNDLQEKVTVLDTGQRSGANGALTSEVQAQTGYITFGKPTAAGSVERSWRIYTGELSEPEKFIEALRLIDQASLSLRLGTTASQIEFKPKQLKAWQRFSRDETDKVVKPGD